MLNKVFGIVTDNKKLNKHILCFHTPTISTKAAKCFELTITEKKPPSRQHKLELKSISTENPVEWKRIKTSLNKDTTWHNSTKTWQHSSENHAWVLTWYLFYLSPFLGIARIRSIESSNSVERKRERSQRLTLFLLDMISQFTSSCRSVFPSVRQLRVLVKILFLVTVLDSISQKKFSHTLQYNQKIRKRKKNQHSQLEKSGNSGVAMYTFNWMYFLVRSVKNFVLLLCGFLRMNAPVFVYGARYSNLFRSSRVLSSQVDFYGKTFSALSDLFEKF